MRNPQVTKRNPTVDIPDLWAPPKNTESLSIGDVFTSYEKTLSGKDRSAKQRAEFWVQTLGEKTLLTKPTAIHVRRVLDALKVQGPTKNRYCSALSAMYSHAQAALEWEGTNPAIGFSKWPENDCHQTGLEAEDIERLLAACLLSSWPKLRLLVLFAIVTGLRRGNFSCLRFKDVDENGRAKAGVTKNGTPFIAVMNSELAAEFKRFSAGAQPDDLIFASPTVPDKPFCFDKQYKAALKRAGLPPSINIHTLRHTCASILARKGASTQEIMDWLNHKTPAMAARYAHLNTSHRQRRVGDFFGGVGSDRQHLPPPADKALVDNVDQLRPQ